MKGKDGYLFFLRTSQVITMACEAALQLYMLHVLTRLHEIEQLYGIRICMVISIVLFIMLIGIFLSCEHGNVITEKKAYTDITGIHNKVACEEKIAQLSACPDTYNVGVIMFDLNDLKKVNDRLGHEKGDALIDSFAGMLAQTADDNSFAARVGGDEFMMIVEHTTSAHIEHMLGRLNMSVSRYNLTNDVKISYASGYAISTRENYYIMDELTRMADVKMYDDKRRYKAEHRI